MSDPRRAITVVPSIAVIQSGFGPYQEHYNLPLDRPVPFRFALGNTTSDDGWTALESAHGAAGRWLDLPEPNLGADLADGDATIVVGGKRRRRLVAGTLTQNSIATLSATNAREGHVLELSLLDAGAFTFAIVNGGPGAGTLATKASGEMRYVKVYFEGTDWVLLDSHAITT